MRKNSQRVIPEGWVCPRNLLFLAFGEEKQIPRFAWDDKKEFFPQPLKPAPLPIGTFKIFFPRMQGKRKRI